MVQTLAVGGTGTWAAEAAGLPPGYPPPPGGPPLGSPPGGSSFYLRALCKLACTCYSGVSPEAGDSGAGAEVL